MGNRNLNNRPRPGIADAGTSDRVQNLGLLMADSEETQIEGLALGNATPDRAELGVSANVDQVRRAQKEQAEAERDRQALVQRQQEQREAIEQRGEPTVLDETLRAVSTFPLEIINDVAGTLVDFDVFLVDSIPGYPPFERRMNQLIGDGFPEEEALNFLTSEELPRLREIDLFAPRTELGLLGRDFLALMFSTNKVSKALKIRGVLASSPAIRAMVAGMLADPVVMDPHVQNLSAFVQAHPSVANPVNEFLSTDMDGPMFLNRLRNAGEGALVGAAAEGLLHSVRLARAGMRSRVQRAAAVLEDVPETAIQPTVQAMIPRSAAEFGLDEVLTLQRYEEAVADLVVAASGKVQTNRETIALAKKINLEDVLSIEPGETLNAAQVVAVKAWQSILDRAVIDLEKVYHLRLIRNRLTLQEEAMFARLQGAALRTRDIAEQGRSAMGRAFQALQIAETPTPKQVLKKRPLIPEGLDDAAAMDIIRTAGGRRAVRQNMARISLVDKTRARRYLDGLKKFAAHGEAFIEHMWLSVLLSSTKLVPRNILSGTALLADQTAQRGLARVLGSEAIAAGEVEAQVIGQVAGIRDGWRLAAKTATAENISDVMTQSSFPSDLPLRPIRAEKFGLKADFTDEQAGPMAVMKTMAALFIDGIGYVFSIPLRGVVAGDALVGEPAARGVLYANTVRRASEEGIDLSSDAGARWWLRAINSPDAITLKQMVDAAEEVGLRAPLGPRAAAFETGVRQLPFSRAWLPFFKPGVNAAKILGVRSPLAPFAKSVRQELAAGGARQDMATMRMAIGTGISVGAYDLAMQGRVTGNRSSRRNTAKTDDRPERAFLFGDPDDPEAIWVQMPRGIPILEPFIMAGDYAEASGHVSDDELSVLYVQLFLRASTQLADQASLQQFSRLLGALYDFDEKRGAQTVQSALSQMAASAVVPSFQRDIRRQEDPIVRQVDDLADRIANRGPNSINLAPSRDIFGEERRYPRGFGPGWSQLFNPIYLEQNSADPLVKELLRLDAPVGMPGRVHANPDVPGATIKLNGQRYDLYVQAARPPAFRAALEEFRSAEGYNLIPDEMRKDQYRKITEEFDEAGWGIVLNTVPGITQTFVNQAMELQGEAQRLLDPGVPLVDPGP